MNRMDIGNSESVISLSYIEDQYEKYVRDPDSVSADWQAYFRNQEQASESAGPNTAGTENGNGPTDGRVIEPRIGPSFKPWSLFNPPAPLAATPPARTAPRVRLPPPLHNPADRDHPTE